MNIIFNEEFEHVITEGHDKTRKQRYRVAMATDVVANLFEHNDQTFDTVYLFVAEDTVGYELPLQEQLARPSGHGYGMVTLYRIPESVELEFRARTGKLFQALCEGTTHLHYQESGSIWVYMKKVGGVLWAFACDDARNYFDFAELNPERTPVDLLELDQEDIDAFCARQDRVVRVSGDENSDNGFSYWLFHEAPVLYRELLALDMVDLVEDEE